MGWMRHVEADQIHRDDLARTVRATPKAGGSRMDKIRKIVQDRQANRVEGLYVDGFTAGMLVAIHDALNEENRQKLLAMPLRKMVDVGWKLYNKVSK